LQCRAGDALNSANVLTTYGISVTTPSASCSLVPVGNWLTSATGGCTGGELLDMSTIDPSARICAAP